MSGHFHRWRTRSIDAWDTLQVELHGHYSAERLLELQNYSNTASIPGLTAIILFTPLPCLFTVILADFTPFNSPEVGTDSNMIFWLRGSMVVWFFTLSFVVQFREMMPKLPMTQARGFGVTLLVSTGVMLYCYSLSHIIGFPVPFLMVMGAPVWTTLLLSCFAISWVKHVRADTRVQGQIVDGLKVFVIQISMIVIYPFYIYCFTKLSHVAQAAFSLLLHVIKMTIKNGISRYIRSQTDMKPEIVIFNVEVFNALFASFCMQNSSTKLTIAVIMAADLLHIAISLREVLLMLRELKEIKRQLDLNEALVRGPEPTVNPSMNAMTRACSILKHMSGFDKDTLDQHSKRSSKQSATLWCFRRDNKVHPHSKARTSVAVHDSTSKSQEPREDQPTEADIKCCTPPPETLEYRLEKIKVVYVHKVARLLHLVEFMILVEYTEVIVPVVYSIYVGAMSYLPNRVYYPQLADMGAAGLQSTLSNVLLYGFLEFISILVLEFVLRKSIKYSPVCQLGFVLRNQWKMVQSKLVLWVLYVVQSSLVHFGADYSFQFAWLHQSSNS
ncbi:hypothetical protein F442_11401 [Phytophthora nicotianae P10297]|uniref:Uncharacterized protein n=1 Tax=Phytophthora nicotianae P10297 TaxID=1317064 RepID=W2Z5L6_PHYNI|nr:hypothetical protein F442_11401 [Phytophthora nicotianae P10297]